MLHLIFIGFEVKYLVYLYKCKIPGLAFYFCIKTKLEDVMP